MTIPILLRRDEGLGEEGSARGCTGQAAWRETGTEARCPAPGNTHPGHPAAASPGGCLVMSLSASAPPASGDRPFETQA